MLLMLAQQLDDALGISNLTTMIGQYLPAEHVASSFITLKQQLPATFTEPTPTAFMVWAMAAIMALAVMEQVKYQIGRIGKAGKQLPGKALQGALNRQARRGVQWKPSHYRVEFSRRAFGWRHTLRLARAL